MIRGYEAAATTSDTTINHAAATLVTGATYRAKVREIGIFSQGATAYRGIIGRPAAVGITPGTQVVGVAQEPADAPSLVNLTTGVWGTSPTSPAPPMRQFDFNNVPGSGVIFTWPSDGEVMISISQNLVMPYNATAGVALDVYAVWGE